MSPAAAFRRIMVPTDFSRSAPEPSRQERIDQRPQRGFSGVREFVAGAHHGLLERDQRGQIERGGRHHDVGGGAVDRLAQRLELVAVVPDGREHGTDVRIPGKDLSHAG